VLGETDKSRHPAAAMKVHHLNCMSMCPRFGKALNGSGLFVAHCLLIESEAGLILVDTGAGLDLVARHRAMLPWQMREAVRPRFLVEETARRQIEKLGLDPADVRHIVTTHLDYDHAGGLADFPDATVHIFEDELRGALDRPSLAERGRYVPALWAHGPRWATARVQGDTWRGFDCVRALPGLPPEILMIPLIGHSRGHAGVAVDVGGRWLLHCGDAYFFKGELEVPRPHCSRMLLGVQRALAFDHAARLHNRERLRSLKATAPDVTLFCAHDPDELAALRA
jgi:glyoxylase-like metal-dependent hydrolase (beta-lactamase superfamily II)